MYKNYVIKNRIDFFRWFFPLYISFYHSMAYLNIINTSRFEILYCVKKPKSEQNNTLFLFTSLCLEISLVLVKLHNKIERLAANPFQQIRDTVKLLFHSFYPVICQKKKVVCVYFIQ